MRAFNKADYNHFGMERCELTQETVHLCYRANVRQSIKFGSVMLQYNFLHISDTGNSNFALVYCYIILLMPNHNHSNSANSIMQVLRRFYKRGQRIHQQRAKINDNFVHEETPADQVQLQRFNYMNQEEFRSGCRVNGQC